MQRIYTAATIIAGLCIGAAASRAALGHNTQAIMFLCAAVAAVWVRTLR